MRNWIVFPSADSWWRNPYPYNMYFAAVRYDSTIALVGLRQMRALRRAEQLHIHWPEGVVHGAVWPVRLLWFALVASLCRLRGGRIVLFLHNEEPHDGRRRRDVLMDRLVARLVDEVVCPSMAAQVVAARKYPRVPVRGVQLAVSPAIVRTSKNCDVLYFGSMRSYKGLEALIGAARALPDLAFRAVGAASEELAAELTDCAPPNLRVIAERVSHDRLGQELAGAPVVLLPFESILNSHSAIQAVVAGCVLVAPRLGALEELEQKAPSWVMLYRGALDFAFLRRVVESPPERLESERASVAHFFSAESAALALVEAGRPVGGPGQV